MSARPCRCDQPIEARCAGEQRLGHQHVVVHGQHVATELPRERRERVRREDHAPCAHPAEGRPDHERVTVLLDRAHRGVLVDRGAEPLGRGGQSPGEPRRVDLRRTRALPEPGEVRRRVDLRAHRVAIEDLRVVAERGERSPRRRRTTGPRAAPSPRSACPPAPTSSRCRGARSCRRSRRGSPVPRSIRSISSGNRARPFSSPWVSDASQKPPLRPVAPNADPRPPRARPPRDPGGPRGPGPRPTVR